MKCPECKKEFTSLSINQKYCCSTCGYKYRKKYPELVHFPVISFYCAYCGKSVVTDGKNDKRTRFCSQVCEKKYWRHPPQDHSAISNRPVKLAEWWEKNSD